MSSPLNQNITNLQNLLDKVNALPEASTGIELPKLSNPATATDLAEGMELIDGNGNIVTGTIPAVNTNFTYGAIVSDFSELKEVMDSVVVTSIPYQDFIIREGSTIGVQIDKSEFGDAIADDVVIDKTFTSAAGVKVTGTNPYEKTATDTEIATQTDLLAQAVAALEGKTAGGNSSIETCDVLISVPYGRYGEPVYRAISYTTVSNGIVNTCLDDIVFDIVDSGWSDTDHPGTRAKTITCVIGTSIIFIDEALTSTGNFVTSNNILATSPLQQCDKIRICTVVDGTTGTIEAS